VDLSARENARLRADTMMRRPPTAALAANSHLSTRLQTLLPAGQTVESAATGFKNLGQLVAATHASHNLNIPFDQLKVRMTGSEGRTLGQAIHELRPDVNAKAEEKKAMKQARADIEAHGETTAQHETRR
jgi:outer membrane murein-binding lipoprotein Lpp